MKLLFILLLGFILPDSNLGILLDEEKYLMLIGGKYGTGDLNNGKQTQFAFNTGINLGMYEYNIGYKTDKNKYDNINDSSLEGLYANAFFHLRPGDLGIPMGLKLGYIMEGVNTINDSDLKQNINKTKFNLGIINNIVERDGLRIRFIINSYSILEKTKIPGLDTQNDKYLYGSFGLGLKIQNIIIVSSIGKTFGKNDSQTNFNIDFGYILRDFSD